MFAYSAICDVPEQTLLQVTRGRLRLIWNASAKSGVGVCPLSTAESASTLGQLQPSEV